MKTTVDDTRLIGTLLGGEECCYLENNGHHKKIENLPIQLSPQNLAWPGTRFTKLGNGSTSAGNGDLYMMKGFYLEYLGLICNLEGRLALFRQVPGMPPPSAMKYIPCFWYYTDKKTGFGYFIYFNRFCSGRVTHLEGSKIMETE